MTSMILRMSKLIWSVSDRSRVLVLSADLLVVGSRGHGTFAEAMLGSVGKYCVHDAHCPLIIREAPGQAARAA